MNVFIIGITGGVGSLLARELHVRGDSVRGLVRLHAQQTELRQQGMDAQIADLATMTPNELADAFSDADAIVYSAGSNGGSREITKAIDGDGVEKAICAAHIAGVRRFLLVSVLPESWRERELGEEVEYYFATKKGADVAVSQSELDWVILRPSLLVDEPGTGTVFLGPAAFHDQIPRADVASTLSQLLHEPRLSRQILELNTGSMPIQEAVRVNVHAR
ncbi:SDR family oxidoreductase [Marinobacter nanhaiticus D15-8W]|uniref:NAD-dependent epimerase/dehydratase family protein n=1 Tax=Marinobacter nanhaiticus D15-8W TaxID=626887 RepID=N6WNZ1_9GAMM|nr:NAD(P)H-binding protein [Marinobacter nanhaiticus]ENO12742.1 NAD-dependent epimerase/dehydratase family protein [Marinobacter nanhaiticus D15-8W]BES70089.1 SDR family oxidoreductase [Marinobacter nanhaiticus D15-8W]